MDYIELNPPRDHLQTMIIDDVLKHLKAGKDDNLALRTALLLAVNLLQMEDDLPAVDFCNAMLGYFAPLARHFDENDNQHPFCGGYKAVRAKDENDNLKVLIPTEYIRYVGGSNLADGPE
jgi:hypothetical protein